jgi:RNA polymerase sigma-70 factor (ECF subfamily)
MGETMTSERNELAHLERARSGSPAAQRLLYEKYHGACFHLAYLLLSDEQDAEEVVQDAFVYAFENLDRYDPDRGRFWTWLRVILVSRCRNKRRRKRLRRVSLDVLDAAGRPPADPKSSGDPVRALERFSTRHAVWNALQEVSPGARDALILRYYEGLPYAEIGELLDCSSAAARARVVHGKAQLRQLLSSLDEGRAPEGGAICGAEAR